MMYPLDLGFAPLCHKSDRREGTNVVVHAPYLSSTVFNMLFDTQLYILNKKEQAKEQKLRAGKEDASPFQGDTLLCTFTIIF